MLLATKPPPYVASIARQATGLGLRQLGDLDGALRELRAAVKLAQSSGRRDREADVLASLGATLGRAGRGKEGLVALDRAVAGSRGALAGKVLLRRADILLVMGRHQEALQDLRGAITRLRRTGDVVWEGRSRNYRGFLHLALGATRLAEADFAAAEQLYASGGQEFEFAEARQNLGLAAFARGDLPTTLACFDEAGRRFAAVGVVPPDLVIDRCAALQSAGLAAEAVTMADDAVARMTRERVQGAKKPELLYTAATAALGAGDPVTAQVHAEQARRLFSRQRRDWWTARASMVQLEARYHAGERSTQLLRRVARLATRLDRLGATEAAAAHLLAGRLALADGQQGTAGRQLELAAKSRRGAPPLARGAAWLGQALRCQAAGNVRGMLSACRRGLDALDEHRLMMGATELRARASAHGAELARLAQSDALRRGDVRRLLAWSERWRATALAVPSVRPAAGDETIAELAALREVVRELEAARSQETAGTPSQGSAGGPLDRERRRLEEAIRARTLHAPGAGAGAAASFDLDDLMAALGNTVLVELVEVDQFLHAIVVADGRVKHYPVGPLRTAELEVERARFRLRRLARSKLSAGPPLDVIGARLTDALLGSAAADLPDGPVVIVPPGRLQALPWTLLPVFARRTLSVAPSSATWLTAHRLAPPTEERVSLVFGPGLATGGAEIHKLAGQYPAATVLGDGKATAERVLQALDGASLAHVAAHGTFRSDSPLFSSLRLDDGPLTVYDLERLRRAPHQLVLSSCESGVAKPVGADELLGLTSSLVPLGAAAILASVVPVNDAAAVPLMIALHAQLQAGRSVAEAFAGVRADLDDEPVAVATANSFVALGA